jgi:hypothetical protein
MVDVDGNGLLGRDTVALLGMKHLMEIVRPLGVACGMGRARQVRKAGPRTVDEIWQGVGKILGLFSRTERANYLKNAGYASM